MKRPSSPSYCLLSILALSLALNSCRRDEDPDAHSADTFPRKSIKVIVPFSAGGGSDTFTRIMQKAIRDNNLLPEALVAINVPGAGGTVGSRRVRDAQADGYTILNLHEGIFSSKYSGRVPYGPEAFRPIAATGESNLVLCVRDDSPFTSLRDLMKATAAKPDTILFGMAQGTPTHFTGRKLELAAEGARFRMVASGGGAKRFNDLAGGHIDVTPFSLAEYSKFSASEVRALAYLAPERHPDLPDLPTAREGGYEVVMNHVQYWWAPKATPDQAVQVMADALEVAMQSDQVLAKLQELKIEPLFLRDQALADHLGARDSDFQDAALVRYEGLPNLVPPVLTLVILLSVLTAAGLLHNRPSLESPNWLYLGGTLGVLALYLFAMQWAALPYLIATTCFIPLMGFAAGARSLRKLVLLGGTGALLATGCFFLFTEVLVIDLP